MVVRLNVPIPAADELVTGALPSLAVSPDGRTVVYRARRDGQPQLFRRELDAGDPVAIADTLGATSPFFSPDGRWLGFDRHGVLEKVAVGGGVPVALCTTAPGGSSSSWGDGGDIVFAPAPNHGLFRVRASGGRPVPVTHLDAGHGDRFHAFPDVLPGGRDALFTIGRDGGPRVALVDLETGRVTELADGRQARFVSSGHVLLVRDDTLWAAPFDPRRRALLGEPRPVLRGLESDDGAHFAVSRSGSLVYVPLPEATGAEGGGVSAPRRLMLVQNWTSDMASTLARAR
jgi:serine/threonine-protein kinase